MPSIKPAEPDEPFDFRSCSFAADAATLARTTGQSMVRCRQHLYIAEGDMALAHELLVAGYDDKPASHTLH